MNRKKSKQTAIPPSKKQGGVSSAVPPSNVDGDAFYLHWFNSQSVEKQKELIEKGLQPLNSGQVDANYIFQVEEEHPDFGFQKPVHFDDEPAKPLKTYDQDEVEIIIRRVVMAMQLSESPEVLFQARCILIAFGMGDPPTETELARIKGCSRQFVSKKVKRIQQLFNLTPSQYMRSEQACKAYAEAWRRAHKARIHQDKPEVSTPNWMGYKPQQYNQPEQTK